MYPLVTIGIPTYNRADSYLKKCLESAVKQTYPNIDIVVSDNCSTDSTEAVVKSLDDQRIRYFKQKENIGPYKNFNFCLQKANGAYFLVLSDDDLVDKDFVDACMKAAAYSTDVGIIRTGTRVIDSQGAVIGEYPNRVVGFTTEEFFSGWFSNKTASYPCSHLFNTNKLRAIGGFKPENNLFHDCFVMAKLAAKFGRVDVEDIKASFRKHHDEITFKVKVKQWCKDSLSLLDEMCSLVPKEDKETILTDGMRFFSTINYNRASAIKSPSQRFVSNFTVFRMFHYKYPPPQLRYFFKKKLFSRISCYIFRK